MNTLRLLAGSGIKVGVAGCNVAIIDKADR